LLYNFLAAVVGPAVLGLTVIKGRLRGNWRERLGFVPEVPGPSPRIWIHAVSVGETGVAAALVKALLRQRPDITLWLTTFTETGREAARKSLPDVCPVLAFPLDAYGSPSRALNRLRPDLIIILETEIWPDFLRTARQQGRRIMLANGRISPRSFGGYRRFRFFFKEVLSYLDRLVMIREEDAARIVALGAEADRVSVAGNAKYDLLLDRSDPERVAALGRELGLTGRPVVVAGSTRTGEDAVLLDVFQRLQADFPTLHLILAPRHVQRTREIETLLKGRNLTWRRRSAPNHQKDQPPDVTLVDVMGELFYLYGLGQAAFVGASLVPLGGQNPLEPAVWGVPVLFGPHMDDFTDAREILLSCGAGRTVTDGRDLYEQLHRLLADPGPARGKGQAGRLALTVHQGAAHRLADLALELLTMDKMPSI
jgi:3-deoxy-D-manno-octulosonic-acid transferase